MIQHISKCYQYLVHHQPQQQNYFLKVPVKSIKTAVMVNRNHKKFPVKADFKGISLATTMNEHISVILDGPDPGIFLT